MSSFLLRWLLPGMLWVCYRLWSRIAVKSPMRNLDGPRASSWLTGNLISLNAPDGLKFNREIVDEYGGAAKVYGFCGDEMIYFSDPTALRHIVTTDLFSETKLFVEINRVVFGDALNTVHGNDHRKQRKILNPAFSPTHLRALAPIIYHTVCQVSEIMEQAIHRGKKEINVLDPLWRAAVQAFGQAVLGHSFEVFAEHTRNDYLDSVKDLFPCLDKMGLLLLFLPLVSKYGTPGIRNFVMNLVPWKPLQDLRRLVDVIEYSGREVLSKRRAALAQHGFDQTNSGKGKDLMTLLLQGNESASPSDRLSDNELIAQINLLIFASSDTTSGALSKTLEYLAKNVGIQDRLREELKTITLEDDLSYGPLDKLPLLDAVVKESLRLSPPLIKMERTAVQDTLVPLSVPVKGKDGSLISHIPVLKNQNVVIGIGNCNRDSRLWGPDCDEWKPDRWLTPLPEALVQARIPGVYSNIMTFLGGERSCIGYNFALMEMKISLSVLVSKFQFGLSDTKVEWKLGAGTQYPVVPGKGPQLPLKVTLVK